MGTALLRQPANLPQGLAGGPFLQARSLSELAGLVSRPRTIFVFGETAAQTDGMVNELLPHLAPRDLIIDAGDSYFKDAERRARKLSERSVEFMSLGIAGGDAAAQTGSSSWRADGAKSARGCAQYWRRWQPTSTANRLSAILIPLQPRALRAWHIPASNTG